MNKRYSMPRSDKELKVEIRVYTCKNCKSNFILSTTCTCTKLTWSFSNALFQLSENFKLDTA